MKRLEVMDLGHNELTGIIPPTLGHISQSLRQLRLNHNRLQRRVPYQLGMLTALDVININGNSLTGTIPSEWGGFLDLLYPASMLNNSLRASDIKFHKCSTLLKGDPREGIMDCDSSASLPPFLELDPLRVERNSTHNFECAGIRHINNHHTHVRMDAEYLAFAHCHCSEGTFGFAPICTPCATASVTLEQSSSSSENSLGGGKI